MHATWGGKTVGMKISIALGSENTSEVFGEWGKSDKDERVRKGPTKGGRIVIQHTFREVLKSEVPPLH